LLLLKKKVHYPASIVYDVWITALTFKPFSNQGKCVWPTWAHCNICTGKTFTPTQNSQVHWFV